MPVRTAGHDDPSLSDALERVVESSQRVLLTRMELLRIEAEEDISRTLWSAAVAFSGVLILLVAWIGLMALSIHWLGSRLSLGGILGLLVTLNVAAGAMLIVVGARAMRGLRLMKPDGSGAEE